MINRAGSTNFVFFSFLSSSSKKKYVRGGVRCFFSKRERGRGDREKMVSIFFYNRGFDKLVGEWMVVFLVRFSFTFFYPTPPTSHFEHEK